MNYSCLFFQPSVRYLHLILSKALLSMSHTILYTASKKSTDLVTFISLHIKFFLSTDYEFLGKIDVAFM